MAQLSVMFIPPIPGWGLEAYGESADASVDIDISQVRDPARVLAVLVDLVGDLVPSPVDGWHMEGQEETDTAAKWRDLRGPVAFDAEALTAWWGEGMSSFVTIDEGDWSCTINCYSAGTQMDVRLTLREAAKDEIQLLCDGFVALLAEEPHGYGFVGLGPGWVRGMPRWQGSVNGYGPAVIASRADLDLKDVDGALVDSNAMSGNRQLLRRNVQEPLEKAVAEIRRICWPGFGYQWASTVTKDTLYFEGPVYEPDFLGQQPVEGLIHRWILQYKGAVEQGVHEYEELGACRGILPEQTAETVKDLRRLAEAWQRGATALARPHHIGEDGFVPMSVTESVSGGVLIEHGPCAKGARAAFSRCIEAWPHAFISPAPEAIEWLEA